MISKIICPTDFSEVANNATQYAARLAQVYGAELLLVHVMPALPGVAGTGHTSISKHLSSRSAEINKLFGIVTHYEVETHTGSLASHIASARHNNAIVVMGTNGGDTLYQRFFGANTYHVVRQAMCPVLVVPQNVEYRSIARIVFAWNYQEDEKFSFAGLHALTQPLNAQYIFLHVSTHRPLTAEEVFKALRHNMARYLGQHTGPQFAQVFAHNVPRGIDDYMKSSGAQLLVLTYFNRKMLRAIFHGGVTKKFIDHVTYPILVLHA